VLWFPLSLDVPNVPYPNPFVLRNWDRLEQEPQTELGTDQFYREAYTGPIPINLPGTVCGTPDQWANGLLYSEWLAGKYACDCPEMIFMSTVASVRNDDGSLTVAPNTGLVEVHVNTSHRNDWLTEQTFKPSSAATPAIECQAFTGQASPYMQCRDDAGALAWSINPSDFGKGSALWLFDTGGHVGGFVSDHGAITLIEHASGSAWGIQQVAITGTGFHRTVMGSSTLQIFVHGATIFSDDAGTNVNVGVPPVILVLGRAGTGVPHVQVRQLASEGGALQFTINNFNGSVPVGHFEVNDNATSHESVATAHTPPGRNGIRVVQTDATPGQLLAVAVDDFTSGPMAGIRFDGHLMTQAVETPTGTGAIVKRWAVYSSAGSLLGYLPLYNTL
jgi:hypothetical protein